MAPCGDRFAFIAGAMSIGAIVAELSRKWSSRSHRRMVRSHGCHLRRLIARWSEPGPTAVLEHGANPGLISHFTKHALLDIARQALADKKFSGSQAEKIAHHAKAQELNYLAYQLGVKVIHCSESDTQIPQISPNG